MWDTVIEAVKAINRWVSLNKANQKLSQERLLDSLVQVHRAANLTRAYYADVAILGLEPGEGTVPQDDPDRRRRDLWEAWEAAGQMLARCQDDIVDAQIEGVIRGLYERCFEKAAYWANPGGWKESGVDIELGNLLRDVTETIESLRHRVGQRQREV